MNHLVIAVSADSSLELLGDYADIIVLDKERIPPEIKAYKSVYVRSHFSTSELLPQNFRAEIESVVTQVRSKSPNVIFIDSMDTVDAIVAFEDKWRQYEKFSDFMPSTRLLSDTGDTTEFTWPIFKKRVSSRGAGVTWNKDDVVGLLEDWIIQESLDIADEIRMYVIKGTVHPLGAIRHSMSAEQKTHATGFRELEESEIQFAAKIGKRVPELDMIGLDIARTTDNKLFLMEVNRSPGFGVFKTLTGVNLADFLYDKHS